MKKLLCILLSVLLVLPFAACGNSNDTAETDTGNGTDGAVTETETEAFFPDIEKKDYGEEFQMIGFHHPSMWYWVEGLTNEPLNDAIYEMSTRISDYLGVEFYYESTSEAGVFNTVSASIASGDDAYQACFLHPYIGYNAFIGNGYALDCAQLDQLDFDQPYWNKNVIENLAINDCYYILLGDLNKYILNILYANKNRLEAAQRQMPYESVRNGTWTWDEFYALSKDLYVDASGDGQRNLDDIYGFAALWDWNAASALQAAGFYVATRNEYGEFKLSIEEEKLVDFYTKLLEWSQSESVYLWKFADELNGTNMLSLLENRSYFTLEQLGTQYLSADFDVGILPLPKYDADQDNYRHVNWGSNIIVPTSVKNTEMVGDVLELRAYFSRELIQTAYYDTVLQYKVSNSADDREMVMLIWNTVVYDPGIAFCDGNMNLNNLVYLVSNGVQNKTMKIASYLKANSGPAQRGLDKIVYTTN